LLHWRITHTHLVPHHYAAPRCYLALTFKTKGKPSLFISLHCLSIYELFPFVQVSACHLLVIWDTLGGGAASSGATHLSFA
ncbi:hypothetical protein ACYT69_09140, partial [Streptococcus pyogenes]